MAMKQITLSLFALSLAAAPLSAQQETPMQMAQRLDACNGAEILSASVDAAGELEVSCATAVAGNGSRRSGSRRWAWQSAPLPVGRVPLTPSNLTGRLLAKGRGG
jgi:hypothetical protein